MYTNDKNEYGCSLYDQTGSMSVRDFDILVAQLPPELRAAFEVERAARYAELARYRASYYTGWRPSTRRAISSAERVVAVLLQAVRIMCLQIR